MRILFDQGVPKPLQAYLSGHNVERTFLLGWSTKKNGELLKLAEEAGFTLLVSTDQNLQHQQQLAQRKLAIFILGRGNWPEIKPYAELIATEINRITKPGIYFFRIPPCS